LPFFFLERLLVQLPASLVNPHHDTGAFVKL
jgi:hypothetical protein